jgi:4-hydroxybenzoate polyprenyltransferase
MDERRSRGSLRAYVAERFPVEWSAPTALLLTGAAIPARSWSWLPVTALVGWLLLLGARAWDDLVDLPRDRLRRPERLLPGGEVPEKVVRRAAVVSGGLGFLGALGLSTVGGVAVALCIAARLGWDARRSRRMALGGPLVVNLAFPALVVAGGVGLGANGVEVGFLAAFAWTAAVAHDLAHGIEEEESMPEILRDPIPQAARARWGLWFFLASLGVAVARLYFRPDPLFGLAVATTGAVVASRFVPLLRDPGEWNARRLRVAGFVYVVAPLAGSMLWSLVG